MNKTLTWFTISVCLIGLVITMIFARKPHINTQPLREFRDFNLEDAIKASNDEQNDQEDVPQNGDSTEVTHSIDSYHDLSTILRDVGIGEGDISKIQKLSKAVNPKLSNANKVLIKYVVQNDLIPVGSEDVLPVQYKTKPNHLLEYIEFRTNDLHDVVISKMDEKFEIHDTKTQLIKKIQITQGKISSSLYSDLAKNKMTHEMIEKIIKLYSFDVDFQRDIKQNDEYKIYYEVFTDKSGKRVKYGNILESSLILKHERQNLTYYFFEGEYYDKNGTAVQKTFLRTPINGARISSGFGKRKHPILGYSKLHAGVDFAAPSGTPVYAAADGIIEFIGWNGGIHNGYGRLVVIKHNATFKTAYAHLSAFKGNLKNGSQIKQGQAIGFVGSTGYATGPHLHYEVRKNDTKIDPKSITAFTSKTIAKAKIAAFKQYIALLNNQK